MGMDILLVEGDARRRVAIGQHLTHCGHRVTISNTIGEAREIVHFIKYKVEAPNAVIVAENLLRRGGAEFRAELGARFPAANCRTTAISNGWPTGWRRSRSVRRGPPSRARCRSSTCS
jgi:hypothetical protein